MAPHLLKCLRRKRRLQSSPALPWEPKSIGIDDSTCQFNGKRTDYMKLPLPPARRPLTPSPSSDLPHANPQRHSPFFSRLPPEVRNLVYSYLFGNRRIHIEFAFNGDVEQWRWWHRVCDETLLFPDKNNALAETCPTTAFHEELHWSLYAGKKNNNNKNEKKKPGKGHRLEGSNWLRTCRIGYKEAMPILYGTNTFALGPDLNRLFRLSKVLPPGHLALITSMDIEVSWMSKHARIPDMDDLLRQTYRSIFRILHRSFPNLRNLRLVFTMVPHWEHGQRRLLTDEVEELWVRPWEELAASRTWDKLEFGVPGSWVPDFTPRADRQRDSMPEGWRYRLVADRDFDIPWPLGRFYANLDE